MGLFVSYIELNHPEIAGDLILWEGTFMGRFIIGLIHLMFPYSPISIATPNTNPSAIPIHASFSLRILPSASLA